ncbi:Maturase [Trichinella spiralis]|uniref:Maturase n=1 Tax=Trichinella spiralis TaxID=6334 RepID=A0ABR3L1R4_TRISP
MCARMSVSLGQWRWISFLSTYSAAFSDDNNRLCIVLGEGRSVSGLSSCSICLHLTCSLPAPPFLHLFRQMLDEIHLAQVVFLPSHRACWWLASKTDQ